ncbi:uncharacterized protein B4U79_05220, partial [Dinothrombium tinctorium]
QFEIYLEALSTGNMRRSEKSKTSLFLHVAGPEAIEVYNTLKFATQDESENLGSVLNAFEKYCNPRKSLAMERYYFNKAQQESEETIDHFITRLKQLAKSCEYGDLEESLIRDRIICGVRCDSTRERLLQEDELSLCGLTLDQSIKICKAAENVKRESNAFQKPEMEQQTI